MHRIEQTQRFRYSLAKVGAIALKRERSTDVYTGKIHWRMSIDDPVSHNPAGTASRLDTNGVEPRGHETAIDLR